MNYFMEDDERGIYSFRPVYVPIQDKDQVMETFLHYSDPYATRPRDVFGASKKGLFYNYSDRLDGQVWRRGCEIAVERGLKPNTARYFEAVLNFFHGVDDVDLQHVVLGCNAATGFSYLVFGYTYGQGKKSG